MPSYLAFPVDHCALWESCLLLLRCRESDPATTITAALGGYIRKNKIVSNSLTSSRTFFNSYQELSQTLDTTNIAP